MRRVAQILILVVIAILTLPMFLPDKIESIVEREFEILPGMIFEDFNNLNEFFKWEPWTYNDSTATKELFYPYRGESAGYQWSSSQGNGELTIIKSEPNRIIEYDLEGFNLGKNSFMNVEFEAIDSTKTNVRWNVTTEKVNYFSRYYTYFTEKKIQEKLESGLDNLANLLETASLTPEQAQALRPGIIMKEDFEGRKMITIQNKTSLEKAEMKTATEESFGQIYSYLVDFIKINPSEIGKPITYFDAIDKAADSAEFYCGYPITESVDLEDGMELFALDAGETLVCIHKGRYDDLEETIEQMKAYAKENNLKLSSSYWEEYLMDEDTDKESEDLQIKIYFPIKE